MTDDFGRHANVGLEMMLPWINRLDRRLGLIGKIGLALAVGALLTAAVAATAWLSFNQVVGLQRRIIDNTVPALEAVGAVTQLNNRSLALVLAALLLYVPANFLPIMQLHLLGQSADDTVWSGVLGLYGSGMGGVAVVAKNTWAARQGRDALVIEWDESQAFTLGSAEILAQYRDSAGKP